MAKDMTKSESQKSGHFYVDETCTDVRGEHHTKGETVRLSYDPQTPYLRRIAGHEYP